MGNFAHTSNERMMNWVTRARSLSQQINLEFNALRIIRSNHHSDNSIPIDESIVMMSLGDVYRLSRRITINHTQYYIFMQLLYWRRRLEEIELIEYKQCLKVQWRDITKYSSFDIEFFLSEIFEEAYQLYYDDGHTKWKLHLLDNSLVCNDYILELLERYVTCSIFNGMACSTGLFSTPQIAPQIIVPDIPAGGSNMISDDDICMLAMDAYEMLDADTDFYTTTDNGKRTSSANTTSAIKAKKTRLLLVQSP
ncbi:zinc finger protein 668-like, partial [Aphis craccivora]